MNFAGGGWRRSWSLCEKMPLSRTRGAIFLRWRPDKPPGDCRYERLEVTKPYALEKVFGS